MRDVIKIDEALTVFLLGDGDHVHHKRTYKNEWCFPKGIRWDPLSPGWLVGKRRNMGDIRRGSF